MNHESRIMNHESSIWCYMMLTHGISTAFHDGVPISYNVNAIVPVPSLSGHVMAYRWRSLPRVRRHRASSLVVPVTGAAFSVITMDHFLCASLFPHSLLYRYVVDMCIVCDTESTRGCRGTRTVMTLHFIMFKLASHRDKKS